MEQLGISCRGFRISLLLPQLNQSEELFFKSKKPSCRSIAPSELLHSAFSGHPLWGLNDAAVVSLVGI